MLASLFVGGCAAERCSFDFRTYSFEMTREVVTSSAVDALVIEACLGSTCRSASPTATGDLVLSSAFIGPAGGAVGPTGDPAKKRVSVIYSVGEGSADVVVLRVRSGDALLLDESTATRWTDDDCHPEPLSQKL